MANPTILEVPVAGGHLTVAASGPDPALARVVIVFVHGITANHKSWSLLTPRLDPSVAALAIDLRGRGGSVGLPGPWGMASHSDDIATVLNYVGVDECIIVGHSMGGFVASMFGNRYPDRLLGAVLVDGGVALAQPDGVEPSSVIESVIGPAMRRLRQTFPSRSDYRSFWQSHPAFSGEGIWNKAMEEYVDYDLGGIAPDFASRVDEAAVRVDGAEVLLDPAVINATSGLDCPTELIRVERGILNEPTPLISPEVGTAVAASNSQVEVSLVPNLNHYTITLTASGVDAVLASLSRVMRRAEAQS